MVYRPVAKVKQSGLANLRHIICSHCRSGEQFLRREWRTRPCKRYAQAASSSLEGIVGYGVAMDGPSARMRKLATAALHKRIDSPQLRSWRSPDKARAHAEMR